MLVSQARRFAEALVARHVLTKEAFEAALSEAARTGEPLEEVVVRMGQVGGKDLAYGHAVAAGIPFVDLDEALEQVRPPSSISRSLSFARDAGSDDIPLQPSLWLL